MRISKQQRDAIISAIQLVRAHIHWKTGKDIEHLETRKRYGHLGASSTIHDYERVILNVLMNDESVVYAYPFHSDLYVGVLGSVEGKEWLVLFGLDGVMETAFPPDDPHQYLERRGFIRIGKLKELLK